MERRIAVAWVWYRVGGEAQSATADPCPGAHAHDAGQHALSLQVSVGGVQRGSHDQCRGKLVTRQRARPAHAGPAAPTQQCPNAAVSAGPLGCGALGLSS